MGFLSDIFGYGDIKGEKKTTVSTEWDDYIKNINEDTLRNTMSVSLGGGQIVPFMTGSQRFAQDLLKDMAKQTATEKYDIEGPSVLQSIAGVLGDLANVGSAGSTLYDLIKDRFGGILGGLAGTGGTGGSQGLLDLLLGKSDASSGIDLGSAIGSSTLDELLKGDADSSGIDLSNVIGSSTLKSLLGEKLLPAETMGGTAIDAGGVLGGLSSAEMASAAAALGLTPETYAAMLGSSGLGTALPGTAAAEALGSVGTGATATSGSLSSSLLSALSYAPIAAAAGMALNDLFGGDEHYDPRFAADLSIQYGPEGFEPVSNYQNLLSEFLYVPRVEVSPGDVTDETLRWDQESGMVKPLAAWEDMYLRGPQEGRFYPEWHPGMAEFVGTPTMYYWGMNEAGGAQTDRFFDTERGIDYGTQPELRTWEPNPWAGTEGGIDYGLTLEQAQRTMDEALAGLTPVTYGYVGGLQKGSGNVSSEIESINKKVTNILDTYIDNLNSIVASNPNIDPNVLKDIDFDFSTGTVTTGDYGDYSTTTLSNLKQALVKHFNQVMAAIGVG